MRTKDVSHLGTLFRRERRPRDKRRIHENHVGFRETNVQGIAALNVNVATACRRPVSPSSGKHELRHCDGWMGNVPSVKNKLAFETAPTEGAKRFMEKRSRSASGVEKGEAFTSRKIRQLCKSLFGDAAGERGRGEVCASTGDSLRCGWHYIAEQVGAGRAQKLEMGLLKDLAGRVTNHQIRSQRKA